MGVREMKDMKWGIIGSLGVVALLVIFYLSSRPTPDQPTARTEPAKLVKAAGPVGLAPAWNVDEPDSSFAQAMQGYLTLATTSSKQLEMSPIPDMVGSALVRKLMEARDAGKIDSLAFLDQQVPLKPHAEPPGIPLNKALIAVLDQAELARKRGDDTRARRIGESLMAVGVRMWEGTNRYYNRQMGLEMFSRGFELVAMGAGEDQELQAKLQPWHTWRKSVEDNWFMKMGRIIRSSTPEVVEDLGGKKFKRIGDLIRLAKEDQDPMIRVEATLGLGLAKFKPGTKANEVAIAEAIKSLQNDPDPQVAKAAKVAEDYTLEEYKRLR
jgi:hypothetical protein